MVKTVVPNSVSIISLFSGPSRPPGNLRAVTRSSTEIQISWDEIPSLYSNGAVLRYEIMYTQLDSPASDQVEVTPRVTSVAAPQTSHLLAVLGKFTLYRVRVRAFNNIGSSPYSEAVEERTLDDGK